ncbi:hypothetical protein IWQ60_004209 [Tieghemiomyces parasiticus]|uniref:RING-type E3 ubiquitin transferase n=1 Tax=Tieghemiomyces parasiticus TaxID=78921 RepID=A0A9W8DU46_9FUNG|nr:hypothetical protein IWQ60_004209 [Tieghemiomyces parasiticus]
MTGVICGSFSILFLILMGRWVLAIRQRRRQVLIRKERRQFGIETLASAVQYSAQGPLSPSLLQYLDDLTIKPTGESYGTSPGPLDTSRLHQEEDRLPYSGCGMWGYGTSTGVTGSDKPDPLVKMARERSRELANSQPSGTEPMNSIEGCVVCLDPIEPQDNIRKLPCKHRFHLDCIDEWLVKKLAVCPLCRFDCNDYCLCKAGPRYAKKFLERPSRAAMAPIRSMGREKSCLSDPKIDITYLL